MASPDLSKVDEKPAHGTAVAVPRKPYAIAFVVGCALFLEMLDATIVAMALPSMAQSLDTDPLGMSIVITAYLLAITVTVPVSGWAADRCGARTIFLCAIGVFAISSLACALAWSLPSLVAARMAQGASAALMGSSGRILILRSAAKSELVAVLSYLAVPALVAPVLGPPIGGFIVVHASWRYIFLLNLPIAALALVLAAFVVRTDVRKQPTPFDARGYLLSSAGLACLVFGLEISGRAESSPAVMLGLPAFGLLMVVAYVFHARRCPYPILDLQLFKLPTFAISVAAGNLCRLSSGAIPFLLALLLQIGFGMNALEAGLIALTTALGALVVKLTVTRMVRHWGFRRTLTCNAMMGGLLIMGCAAFEQTTPHVLIGVTLLGLGFLKSLQLTAASTLGYAEVGDSSIAAATSLASTVRYLAVAGGVGIAALSIRISATLNATPQPSVHDIGVGFVVIGALFFCSALIFWRLRDAAAAALIPVAEQVRERVHPERKPFQSPGRSAT